ncbi:hypothetical protein GCM10009547_18300 [Sporichthya brevicatena]|uniref:HTH tetR-type domain-containing protein n=1 Tax=Sporichthya brevicatena TaxID=171442 RepID=A0ABN1GQU4_9ACTN
MSRDALLRAGADHFSAAGYAGASVRAILTDAGVTAPALYHHFENKAGLYIAVAETAYAEVVGRFRAAADTAETMDGRLGSILDVVCVLRREHPRVARFFAVIEQDVRRHPELAELSGVQDTLSEFWSTLLARATPAQVLAVRAIVEGLLGLGDETLPAARLRATARELKRALAALALPDAKKG